MRMIRRVLTELGEARRDPRRVGRWAGVGAGLMVGAPVARCFLDFGHPFDQPWGGSLLLAPLATICTGLGTMAAVRAPSTGRAIAWSFGSNVVPPTVVCAPSVLGLFFSVPSGLAAFAVTLPIVLASRWASRCAHRRHPSVAASWERGVGAGFLGLTALGLVWYEYLERTAPYAHGSDWMLLPALVAATGALTIGLGTAGTELTRLWVRRALGRGVGGLRLRADGTVENVRTVGLGPQRTAPTRDPLGRLVTSWPRALLALAAATLGGAALTASIWLLSLPDPPRPF